MILDMVYHFQLWTCWLWKCHSVDLVYLICLDTEKNQDMMKRCNIKLVFVVKVALVSHGLAQAEGEDDAEDLNSEDGDGHDDHDVQVGDDPIVDGLVATLKQTEVSF